MDQSYFQSLLHQQLDPRYLQNFQLNLQPTQNQILLGANRNNQLQNQVIRPIPQQIQFNSITDNASQQNRLKDREHAVSLANLLLNDREHSVSINNKSILQQNQAVLRQSLLSNVQESVSRQDQFLNRNPESQITKQIPLDTFEVGPSPLKENKINIKSKQTNSINKAEVISHDEHLESIRNSPAYYLSLFLDIEIINYLLNKVNDSLRQSKSFSAVSEDEIHCFLGILYLSGYLQVPRRRMLWERSQDTQNALVSNAMQRDRFEAIFSALNSKEAEVELHPMLERLNENFLKYYVTDEQHSVGELAFLKGKLEKVAKICCGCTRNGYCVFFKPMRLDQMNFNHFLSACTKNYVQRVAQIHRINNLCYEGISGDAALLDNLRHFVTQPICCTKEKTGLNPPLIGLDRLQTNLGLYKISIGGKKMFSQLLTFSLDVAMQNAWILYKNSAHPHKKVLDLLSFRRNVVVYYLQHYRKPILLHKGGRPLKKRRGRINLSPSDARFDGIRHYVVPQQKQTRCAKCTSKTTTRCQKCDVGVHVKCFVDFHSRPKEL